MQVYIGQFGGFWKLTWKQWQELCTSASDGSGYDLSEYRQQKRRPGFIHRDPEDGVCWTCRDDILYFEPLDWHPEQFAEHIVEGEIEDQEQEEAC